MVVGRLDMGTPVQNDHTAAGTAVCVQDDEMHVLHSI